MNTTNEQFFAKLEDFSRGQIREAGHRYTPAIDREAPNLRIESLFTAIENLACGSAACARFASVLNNLSDGWARAKHCSQRRSEIERRLDTARAGLAEMISLFRIRDSSAVEGWLSSLGAIETDLQSDVAHWRLEAERLAKSPQGSPDNANARAAQGNLNDLNRCLSIVFEEKEYTQTPAFKVLSDPQLLIGGEWGTGKTHLLCDVTQSRINCRQSTVLVLAKNFQGEIVEGICGRIATDSTVTQVFDQLQDTANRLGERCVVVIDGVNEGNRKDWLRAVTTLRLLVKDRPSIGLIISCRTPFERVAIAHDDMRVLHTVTHRGFEDQEFDAQAAFFKHFNLPLPQVPLLDKEFSRPLTLKLICQYLKELKPKKFKDGFAGIAQGQKGMTFVLESFVNEVGKDIEEKYGLRHKGCWLLLKGASTVADSKVSGFAPCMAAALRGFVRPVQADRIIAAHYPCFGPAKRRELLEALRTNGLLEEDVVWYRSKSGTQSRIVFRLPYQRFSDHLIARHLLKPLKELSVDTIKNSFRAGSPLARIFKVANRYQNDYAEPGLAQALITEFPERIGNKLPEEERELFFVLPHKSQNLAAYFSPFVSGLFWRHPSNFTKGTDRIVQQFLSQHAQMWDETVDALAAIATKSSHPYSAQRFYDFLARCSMPERDLTWSEYLRRSYASPTIKRLLTWSDQLGDVNISEASAKPLVVLLSLVLTTVVRNDRDRATKALVLIGEQFPEILFAHVLVGLDFNDPYVPERLLAAAYGVTMSLVDSERAATFRPVLRDFGGSVYKAMFGAAASYATQHTLTRDYALGIVQIAQRAGRFALPKSEAANLLAPSAQIPSTFTSDGSPDAAVAQAIGRPIHMDFGNYTIGRLIPNRRNYDEAHPEYLEVRSKIERRIFDLGYRMDLFGTVDKEIGRSTYRSGDANRVDRYGKKYSWIAYFEMWGERDAKCVLPDWRANKRTSDCDLDPSFPKRPPAWTPPIPDLFDDLHASTEAWVAGGFTPNWTPLLAVTDINGNAGDWVLLDGYIGGSNETNDRELFAFLRGVFVSRRDVVNLRGRFLAADYPGNHSIPEADTGVS